MSTQPGSQGVSVLDVLTEMADSCTAIAHDLPGLNRAARKGAAGALHRIASDLVRCIEALANNARGTHAFLEEQQTRIEAVYRSLGMPVSVVVVDGKQLRYEPTLKLQSKGVG